MKFSRWIVSFMPLSMLFSASVFAFPIKETRISFSTPGQVKLIISPASTGANPLSIIDLLFVIDDSGSMGAHQTLLANEMVSLASHLKSVSSLNVAVTTTSMSQPEDSNGRFQGTPKVMTSNSPDFGLQLQKNIRDLGINGNYQEKMFDPVIAALSPPLIDNENAGFLRPDSHLGVVFVTDTEDQGKASPEDFVTFLDKLKGAGNYSVAAFMVPSNDKLNCPRDNSPSLPTRIEKALELSGGSGFNICEGNFSTHLQSVVGKIIRSVERTVVLPYKPIFQSITVKYGPTLLQLGDIHHGWIYDSVANSVVLGDQIDWNAAPRHNIEIEFSIQQSPLTLGNH